jgi:hypothetical protein
MEWINILWYTHTMEFQGGVAQVVEHLPRKHEALNLTPSTTKN